MRRIKEEPLVPLGCLLTVAAFMGATRAMRKNDHVKANIMFRRRIYAQGLTIAALVAGSSYWGQDRKKREEFQKAEKERTKMERRDRWLAELEARDREDKEMKERILGQRRRREEGEGAKQGLDAASSEGGDTSPLNLVAPSDGGNSSSWDSNIMGRK